LKIENKMLKTNTDRNNNIQTTNTITNKLAIKFQSEQRMEAAKEEEEEEEKEKEEDKEEYCLYMDLIGKDLSSIKCM